MTKTSSNPKPKAVKANAFASAANLLGDLPGGGIDSLFGDAAGGPQYSLIPLDDIEVREQIRTEFEDTENTLDELAKSIAQRGVLQPVLLRPLADGKYHLVAGERRLRASKLAGLTSIPAYIRDLTDEEADDAQLAENIQRKNLTMLEEARRLQRDLEKLGGGLDALAAKHQKSKAWLSKILGLLKLPEQASRVISEKISADPEVIHGVRQIEQADPQAAAALVDTLAKNRGATNARKTVEATRERVAPKAPKKAKAGASADTGAAMVATPRDRSFEDPSRCLIKFRPASAELGMDGVWSSMHYSANTPAEALAILQRDEQQIVSDALRVHYDAGKQCRDVGRAVIEGLRKQIFATEGRGAFALAAFLAGADGLPVLVRPVRQGQPDRSA